MDIKEELKQILIIRCRVKSIARQIEELEASKTSIKSPQVTGMPKKPTMTDDSTLDTIIDRINELQEAKKEQIDQLIDIEERYTKAMGQLDHEESLVLELRYFEGYQWQEVSSEMHYSQSRIHEIHGQALNKLREIMK